MKKFNIFMFLSAALLLTACHNSGLARKASSSDIPYTLAERYFQNNDVKTLPTNKVTTEKDFENLFGAAPVMGKNGMPTPIDFSKEYVIAVSKPETYYSTELMSVSLKRDTSNNIIFTYKVVTKGGKQTYSIVPCLLIIVNNKEQGKITVREIQ